MVVVRCECGVLCVLFSVLCVVYQETQAKLKRRGTKEKGKLNVLRMCIECVSYVLLMRIECIFAFALGTEVVESESSTTGEEGDEEDEEEDTEEEEFEPIAPVAAKPSTSKGTTASGKGKPAKETEGKYHCIVCDCIFTMTVLLLL